MREAAKEGMLTLGGMGGSGLVWHAGEPRRTAREPCRPTVGDGRHPFSLA